MSQKKDPLSYDFLVSLIEKQMRKINTMVAYIIAVGSRDSIFIFPTNYAGVTENTAVTIGKATGTSIQKEIGMLERVAIVIGGKVEINTDGVIETYESILINIDSLSSEKDKILQFQVKRDITGKFAHLIPLSTDGAEIRVNITPKIKLFADGLIASVTSIN